MKTYLTHITNLWAMYVIKTLVRGGVRHFCIAPGSRNAPLTLALAELSEQYSQTAQHQNIVLHTHFDERGLGFYALGISKSTNTPVAVITTSGTAVPNLYPAVVESFQTHTPLIVLSADRPPELLSCGANQAIQQQKIFGRNVVHYEQLDLPCKAIPLQTLVNDINICLDYAIGAIEGKDSGPVHINCPFREPLYGNNDLSDHTQYIEALSATESLSPKESILTPTSNVNKSLSATIDWERPGIIVAGSLSIEESLHVLALARSTGWPILADICSQLRLNKDPHILHYADLLMANSEALTLLKATKQLIQFGGRITSKRINKWLGSFQGEYIIIDRHHDKLDPHHKATQFRTSIKQFCGQVGDIASLSPIYAQLISLNIKVESFVGDALSNEFSELSVARTLSQVIPAQTAMFTGNSLAIRLVDMFSSPTNNNPIYSNRGASGIDGLLATAVGCSQTHPKGISLLIGDLSLLHDLNSLALASKQNTPFVIVVLNNDGGSIFNMLPVDNLGEVKETFFQCPHGLDFEGVCKMFSITYLQPKTLEDFKAVYLTATERNSCSLIEITVPSDQATSRIKQLTQLVATLQC